MLHSLPGAGSARVTHADYEPRPFLHMTSSALDGVRRLMLDFPTGGIAIAIGLALLFAYRYYPEKFPRKLTAKAVRWRAVFLIVGGVVLSIWDALRRLY